jgi:hypothetical protein
MICRFQELQDYRYRLAELERALLLAEERLHEHNIVDENLSAMLAQLKLHSDEQLRRYKHESECSYQSHVRCTIYIDCDVMAQLYSSTYL